MSKVTTFERVGLRLGEGVVKRRAWVIALSLLLFAVASLGLGKARFSTDYRVFFSKEDPGLTAFERLESVFTKTDNVLFVVKSREGSAFDADALEAAQELTEKAWKIPYATRVDSLTNFQHARVVDDDIAQGELVAKPARSLTAAERAYVRDVAVHEPLLYGSLLARDEMTSGVNVTLRLPGKNPDEVSEAARAARTMVAEVSARHPGLDIRPSGMAFMNDAFMQASIRDLGVMLPLMLVVVLVAMGIILRSVAGTAAVAVILAMSAALSMAVAGWLHYPLTPPAVAAPMIVLTVAVADGVHMVLAMMEALREGKTKREAIVASVQTNLEAITYTWLTTIVGFVCLNYSDAPPVRHLANMTCVGVTVAFVLSFTLLPALCSLLPLRAARAEEKQAGDVAPRSQRAMEWLTHFVIRRRGLVLAACAVVTAGFGYQASQLETNDQFVKYFDTSIPFRRDVDFTMKNLSGIYRLEYQVGSEAGIADPEYLAKLDGFAAWLRAQPEVEHVYAVTDIVKRVNQVVHKDETAFYRTPSTREEASQLILLYEMGLPAGLDLTDRIDVAKSASRVTVTVKDMSTKDMTRFTVRSEQWLRDGAPRPMWAEATGPVVIFSRLSDRNARNMVQGDFVSLALISLCMVIVLRSLKLGLLSILPNVIPIVLGYGIWRVCVGQMNIVASVAGSISLGIIVDDTIHFLTKFQTLQRQKGLSPEAAMKKTMAHVGPAMLGTSVILVLGFGVLTLSSFQMTSYLGWLSVLIVGVAPLADLVLAPALVLLLVRKRPATKPDDRTDSIPDASEDDADTASIPSLHTGMS